MNMDVNIIIALVGLAVAIPACIAFWYCVMKLWPPYGR